MPTQESGKDFRDSCCPEGYIKFGHSKYYGMTDRVMWEYADLVEDGDTVTLPVVVMVDVNNKTVAAFGEWGTSPFLDVKSESWMERDINLVYEKGIMNGVGNDENFAPGDNLIRARFATVLYRMAGKQPVTCRSVFHDVPAGTWYSEAVVWAYDAGVVNDKGMDLMITSPGSRWLRCF